jgi:hypothetical protein
MLDLSNKERMVLGEFMKIQSYLRSTGDTSSPFSTTYRKKVKDSLKMSAHSINNYIKVFRTKKVVVGEEGSLEIVQVIIPEIENNKYKLTFTFDLT